MKLIFIKLKHIISAINSGNSITKENIFDNGLFPVYGGGGKIGYCNNFNCEKAILIGRVGSCGNITLVNTKCFATDNALILNTLYNLRYMMYVLKSLDFFPLISQTAMPLLTGKRIRETKVLFTFEELEQKKIVAFLDAKCDAIGKAIAHKRSVIEKLKEYRTAVITKAVTKGLNPDVEMKDSEIKWVTSIPKNWDVVKIKYFFTIKKRIIGHDGSVVLSITQKGIVPKDITSGEGQLAESYANYQIVEPGDFAMNHMDLLTGWIDISNYSGVTSPDYRVFTINNRENNSKYYLYMMQMFYFNRIFYSLGAGVSGLGRWRLQRPAFLNLKILVPPIMEQNQIVNYLDAKCSKIDAAIQQQEQAIAKLEEYRKSVIYYAVTGKIDCGKAV